MTLLELNNYTLVPEKNGKGIHRCDLYLEKKEIISIRTDSANDAHLFIKGLATLSYPVEGTYLFQDHKLDFSDYRELLSTKKKIGYLTSSTTLISNRSVRDNLCLGQVYFGNDLSMKLDQEALALCRKFKIDSLLEERPVNIGLVDNKRAMVVRELMKKPRLMLVEHPEDFSSYDDKDVLINALNEEIKTGMALVFLSDDKDFINAFPGNVLEIKDGKAISRTHNG